MLLKKVFLFVIYFFFYLHSAHTRIYIMFRKGIMFQFLFNKGLKGVQLPSTS